MPFLRTPNGLKHPVSQARLALVITQAFEKAYGAAVVQHRRSIQTHALRAWAEAETRLGAGEFDEWNERELWVLVGQDLRQHGPSLVADFFHDTWLSDSAQHDADQESWGHFEGKPTALDPKWIVRWPAPEGVKAPPPQAVAQLPWDPRPIAPFAPTKAAQVPLTRSDWQRFWESEARQMTPQADVDTWFREAFEKDRDQKTLDAEGWWAFWQAHIEQGLVTDPRLVGLLARMSWRQAMAEAGGGSWLSGTPGQPSSIMALADEKTYRQAAFEHLSEVRTLAGWKISDKDLLDLTGLLRPERDRKMGWIGWITLHQQAALWPVTGRPLGRELPQWMWLRTAMGLCQGETSFTRRVAEAYDAFSLGRIVPSEVMMRQAGKPQPMFMEDQAGWVEDDFERIYQAIHRAAVDTKWNGTVSLDWSRVRPRGASAAAGRTSTGVVGFLQAISMALSAQGRAVTERPVTAMLPLWHGDVVHLMDAVDKVPHIQPVLAIPDLFFRRLREQGAWVLFDPSVFPEVLEGDEGILRAEARLAQMRQDQPRVRGARVVRANALWHRLLRCVSTHAPALVFPSSVQAFSPHHADLVPIMGRDGIGAMPLPREGNDASIRWPALAVNLASLVDHEGHPDHALMQASSELALRLLDNAIETSHGLEPAVLESRPVCVGLIGLYETLERITQDEHDPELTGRWMESIAKAWNTYTDQADALLARERGKIGLWGHAHHARPEPHAAIERLRSLRQGELSMPSSGAPSTTSPARTPGRFAVRTIWAPFLGLARIAGVTPGGFGTLHPIDRFEDNGSEHIAPSAFLMHALRHGEVTAGQAGKVLAVPNHPQRWPRALRSIVYPDQEHWRIRLHQAAMLRPHADQGVSLSLPHHLDKQLCAYLIHLAWRLGLSNVLFVVQGLGAEATEDVVDRDLESTEWPPVTSAA